MLLMLSLSQSKEVFKAYKIMTKVDLTNLCISSLYHGQTISNPIVQVVAVRHVCTKQGQLIKYRKSISLLLNNSRCAISDGTHYWNKVVLSENIPDIQKRNLKQYFVIQILAYEFHDFHESRFV